MTWLLLINNIIKLDLRKQSSNSLKWTCKKSRLNIMAFAQIPRSSLLLAENASRPRLLHGRDPFRDLAAASGRKVPGSLQRWGWCHCPPTRLPGGVWNAGGQWESLMQNSDQWGWDEHWTPLPADHNIVCSRLQLACPDRHHASIQTPALQQICTDRSRTMNL